jgi:Ca2+-binding RTX toxin-like protein
VGEEIMTCVNTNSGDGLERYNLGAADLLKAIAGTLTDIKFEGLGDFVDLGVSANDFRSANPSDLSNGDFAGAFAGQAANFGVAAGVTALLIAASPVEIPALALAATVLAGAAALMSSAAVLARLLNDIYCPPHDPNEPLNHQPVSPLIIDLDGNGVRTIALDNSVAFFDLNGDGFAEHTAWASPADGILALDRNGNGQIDDIGELFGTATSNGFTVLSQFDNNHDGVIDNKDVVYSQLRIWVDTNSDGVSTASELHTLSELGLKSIDAVGSALPSGTLNNGNPVSHTGQVVFTDGHISNVDDVWFQHDVTITKVNTASDFNYSGQSDQLPFLAGMGTLADLKYSVTVDSSLAQMVQQLVLAAPHLTGKAYHDAFEQVLLKWAGAENIAPDSRGGYVDARHLAVLEKLYATDYIQVAGLNAGTGEPGFNAAYGLELTYEKYLDKFISEFSVQVLVSTSHLTSTNLQLITDAMASPFGALTFLTYDSDAREIVNNGPIFMGHMILGLMPTELVGAVKYLDLACTAISGLKQDLFEGNATQYEAWLREAFASISNVALREYAVERALSGTSPMGTSASESLIVTDPSTRSGWNWTAQPHTSAIWSGAGDDVIGAGAGGDSYLFLKGDGHDTIIDDFFQGAGGQGTSEAFLTANDKVIFADRNSADAIFTIDGNDLLISFADSPGDSLRIKDQFLVANSNTRLTNGEYFQDKNGNYLPVNTYVGRIEEFFFRDGSLTPENVNTIIKAALDAALQGAGYHVIHGLDTDETFNSGIGNDVIYGGGGSDTYQYAKGDGKDVYDEQSNAGSIDSISFADLKLKDISFQQAGTSLVINFSSTDGGSVTINNQPLYHQPGQPGIEKITFSDGINMMLLQAEIAHGFLPDSQYIYTPTDASSNGVVYKGSKVDGPPASAESVFVSGATSVTFNAGATGSSSDTFIYKSGDAAITIRDLFNIGYIGDSPAAWNVDALILQGLSFADVKFVKRGDNLLIEKNGQVIVTVEGEFNTGYYGHLFHNGLEVIIDQNLDVLSRAALNALAINTGTAGNDFLIGWAEYGSDTDPTTYGNDKFKGGKGDDIINDYNGSDTYYYAAGDGNDIIFDKVSTYKYDPRSDFDKLILTDLNRNQVQFEKIEVTNNTGGDFSFPSIEFHIRIIATGETIQIAGQFTDGMTGIEQIVFADGTTIGRNDFEAQSVFHGTAGNDVIDAFGLIDAGKGDDHVYGAVGNSPDTLIYKSGDGNDTIKSIEVLQLSDIKSDGVEFLRNDYDLVVKVKGTGETITEHGFFLNQTNFTDSRFARTVAQNVYYADLASSIGAVECTVTLFDGSPLPAWLHFNSVSKQFTGTDPLGLNQTIGVKVTGTDSWTGLSGSVDFQITAQNGVVAVTLPTALLFDPADSTTITATLADGTALPAWLNYNAINGTFAGEYTNTDSVPSKILVTETIGHLTVTYELVLQALTINDFAHGSDLQTIVFSDGVHLTQDQIASLASSSGTVGDDVIIGLNETETIGALAGNDVIYANGGDDTIIGGAGLDELHGGIGNDRFVATTNDHDLLINGDSGLNTLDLSALILGVNVDLQLGHVTGPGYTLDSLLNIQAIAGTRADDTILGSTGDDQLNGQGGNDLINGGAGNDTIEGGIGADTLFGGLGTDTLSYLSAKSGVSFSLNTGIGTQGDAAGDVISGFEIVIGSNYNDSITGDQSANTIQLGAGDDQAFGLGGDDLLHGGAGADTLNGGADNDTLSGDSGNDTLVGGAGNDLIIGGKGSDILTDDAGNETFVWTRGDGSDTIQGGSFDPLSIGEDTLLLHGVNATEVKLTAFRSLLTISLPEGAQISVNDQFATSGLSNGLEKIVFDDGTVWLRNDIVSHAAITANAAPVTLLDRFSVAGGTTLSVSANQLISNDIDLNGDSLALTAVGNAQHGTVTLLPDGSISFLSETGFIGAASFEYTVVDAYGGISIGNVAVTVTQSTNQAPIVSAVLLDVSSQEDSALSFVIPAGSFTDADNSTLSYSATLSDGAVLPTWLNFNATTQTFSGTPPQDYNGSVDVKVTVSDGSLSASDIFTLAITPMNDAPIIATLLADKASAEDSSLSFTLPIGSFTDVDNATLTYSATLASGAVLPSWLNFDAITQTFAGTPPQDYYGNVDVKVTASDGNLTTSDIFTLTITPVNDAPIVAALLADKSSAEDTSFSFTLPAGSFTDVDNATLSYSATLASGAVLPSWLNFNSVTQTFSGMPPQDYNGNVDVKVSASDGSLTATDIFTLTITPVNDAPIVAVLLADKFSPEDTIVNFTIPVGSFTDVDNATLNYSATLASGAALPSWLSFNAATQSFSGTPPQDYFGNIDVKVTASDGSLTNSDIFTLTITPVNDAPIVATLLTDSSSAEDTALSFKLPAGSFTDVDNAILSYSATLANGAALPSWIVFDSITQTFIGNPPLNFNGMVDVKVTASDGSLSASDVFTLTISPVNDAPIVETLLADKSSAEDTSFSFALPVGSFTDVDNAVLSYSATLANGTALPSWVSFDALTQTFSGVPPLNFNGSLDVKVTASDGSLTASDIFTLTITPVNDAPIVATLLADKTSAEDTAFSFTLPAGSFTDVDNTTLTYSATLATGAALPSWLSFNAVTQTFSGTPPLNFNGNFDVKVTASDGSLSASDVFTLAVTPVNDAPIVTTLLPDKSSAEDTAFNFTVPAGSFTDVDNGTLTYSATLGSGAVLPSWLIFNATTQTFSGTPPLNFNGNVDVKVTASDGSLSASDVFTLTITPVNDGPVATNDTGLITTFNTALTILPTTLLANDTDVDGDTLSITAVSSAVNGTVALTATGNVIFTPTAGFSGVTSFNYTISDGHGGTATASVSLTVQPSQTGNVINGTASADLIIGTAGIDVINGLAGNDVITAGAGNDIVNGGAGNDVLDGGSGADTLNGGTGDDTYVVDNFGDVVNELPNEGIDLVTSTISWSLGANLENLTLLSLNTTALNGTGNSLNNVITGTLGDNILDGGLGADTLIGGAGNDTYVVDNIGDVITELVGAGIDVVQSSINWTLGANLDNLNLTGLANINGTGNGLNNIVTGNAGNNVLDGGGGTDTLAGGLGNDTYMVNQTTGLTIAEAVNAGTDTVISTVTYTLGTNLENLTLAGTTAINGTGNTLDNILIGNAGANTLNGGAGTDFLTGGGGNDILTGGTGNDTFNFSAGFGKDTLTDFTAGLGATDVLHLTLGAAFDTYAEVMAAATQVGSNTLIAISANDTITLTNVLKTALVVDDFSFI